MNKILIVVIIIFSISFSNFPQDLSFYDAPLGGGIGYTPGWIITKTDGINSRLNSSGYPQLPKGGFFTSGVSGFIYLGLLKNFRIGGFGFGGSRSVSGNYAVQSNPADDLSLRYEQRETRYSVSGGGISIEYTLPYIKDIAVSMGTLLGRGSLSVELNSNSGSQSWQNTWPGGLSTASSLTLKNSYWLVVPVINVEIPLYHMLCFRIGTGYNFSLGNSWKYNNDKDITNAPSDINGNGYFIQTGIFIGLFSF